jgi:hypothetical protein
MKKLLLLFFITLSLGFSACKKNYKKIEAEKTVKEWINKTIQFPEGFSCSISGKDTNSVACSDLLQKEYKILLYTDFIDYRSRYFLRMGKRCDFA